MRDRPGDWLGGLPIVFGAPFFAPADDCHTVRRLRQQGDDPDPWASLDASMSRYLINELERKPNVVVRTGGAAK